MDKYVWTSMLAPMPPRGTDVAGAVSNKETVTEMHLFLVCPSVFSATQIPHISRVPDQNGASQATGHSGEASHRT